MFKDYTSELAYCLGFIWGDGYIGRGNIVIEIVKEDLLEILPIFEKCFNCVYSERSRPNRKPQASIRISNSNLVNFLNIHGYVANRFNSPESIINLFPEELRKFWYLGFLDADGCWYYNFKNSCSQCTFSGNYKQDWYFIENIFNYLNIKFSKQVILKEKQSSSNIRTIGKSNIIKFGKYLYSGHSFGLQRKKAKFDEIENHYKQPYSPIGELAHLAKLKNLEVIEIKKLFPTKTNEELALIFNVSNRIINRIRLNETWKHIN